MVDRDGVVAETQDTVESMEQKLVCYTHERDTSYLLAESKCKTRLLGSLCKVLTFDGYVTNCEDLVRNVTLHGASAVLDREFGSIGFVRVGSGSIVLGM